MKRSCRNANSFSVFVVVIYLKSYPQVQNIFDLVVFQANIPSLALLQGHYGCSDSLFRIRNASSMESGHFLDEEAPVLETLLQHLPTQLDRPSKPHSTWEHAQDR